MVGKRRQNNLLFPILAVIVLAAAFFLISRSSSTIQFTAATSTEAAMVPASVSTSTPEVIIDNTPIYVDLSITNAQIQQGLSGRATLGANDGMLFLFAKPAIYRFWMPDMNFPLDMIWINDGKIVDISANVPTTFNPAAPIFYKPKAPAEEVLEVNANFSANHNISIGDSVTFENVPLGKATVQ